jgi:general secretion pathway protein E
MSTMHAGEPAAALLRLLEMGIEPYQVTSSVSAVLNQRLLRLLCPDCGDTSGQTPRAVGCPHCLQSGYRGRTLVAELIELDGDLRKALLNRADLDNLQAILHQRGHMALRHHAMQLVRDGRTTHEEVWRVCGQDT